MKAYGVPRDRELNGPDMGTLQQYALKSSASNISGKSGDFHSSIRSTEAKNRTRRYWKRQERAAAKNSIRKELKNI